MTKTGYNSKCNGQIPKIKKEVTVCQEETGQDQWEQDQ